ncbi:MAG: ParB/RepB/Spo0J family partition protein [Snowella sp.]|nr:ParB/RepB/Spo0J family partition protein [Snowella sp.]
MSTAPRKQNKPYKAQANLDDLLGMEEPSVSQYLPLFAIVLPKSQPRRYFDADKLNQLTESIKTHGILENLVVRPLEFTSNQYELVAGERRYRAAKAAGLTEVPVTIKNLSSEAALEIALIENLQREDLNPIEETEGILSLLSYRLQLPSSQVPLLLYQMLNARAGKITNNVISNEQSTIVEKVFQEVGRMSWESFVTNRLSLLKLPSDILEALRQGQIEYTKAKAISKVKDEDRRAELLEEAIQNQLSLTQIKARIAELKPSPNVNSSENKAQNVARRLKQLKLWEKDKKAWKKVEGWLDKIENLLLEIETDQEKIIFENNDSLKISFAKVTEENQIKYTEQYSIFKENNNIMSKDSLSDEKFDEDEDECWDCDI